MRSQVVYQAAQSTDKFANLSGILLKHSVREQAAEFGCAQSLELQLWKPATVEDCTCERLQLWKTFSCCSGVCDCLRNLLP